jgi:hypothetical protein
LDPGEGALDGLIIGIASTAPVYSLATVPEEA